MIFLALFFCFTIFSSEKDFIPLCIVDPDNKPNFKFNLDDFDQLTKTISTWKKDLPKDTKKIKISLDGFDLRKNSYKENFKKLGCYKSIITLSTETSDYEYDVKNQIETAQNDLLFAITARTHLIALLTSCVEIFFLKRFLGRNIAFLLPVSLTVPYWHDYEYFKKKNGGRFANKIVDLALGLIVAIIILRFAFY